MNQYFTNTWAFVVVLGIIIFVHEFGHFITAKAFGIRVFIFSFGFGKRLWGFKWGDTDCRLSLVPLGGYVKLEGEPDDVVSEDVAAHGDGRDFTSRPRWQRILVYLAGPAMNAVLTLVVMTALFVNGVPVPASLYDSPVIGAIEDGSPAAAARLQPGDVIEEIDGARISTWEDALFKIWLRPDTIVHLRVRRGGTPVDVEVRSTSTGQEKAGKIGVSPLVRAGEILPDGPAQEAGVRSDDGILSVDGKAIASFSDLVSIVTGAAGRPLNVRLVRGSEILDVKVTPRKIDNAWRIGISSKMVVRRFGFFRSVEESGRWSWEQTKLTFETVGRLLTGALSPKSMMGPLGIAKASGETAQAGPIPFFSLIAMVSLQVGILNLFPLAPLDGGHLAILVAEGAVRRDFSDSVKAWIMNVGVLLIFGLIGIVLYADLSKTSFLGKYLP
jgi:regulator of sigma E protease